MRAIKEGGMDMGELFKKSFRVLPGCDGSFILSVADNSHDRLAARTEWGFTSLGDLMLFLDRHANARIRGEVPETPATVTVSGQTP